MTSIADYAAVAARLLAEHPELAEPAGVTITAYRPEHPIAVQMREKDGIEGEAFRELAQWARACDAKIALVALRNCVDAAVMIYRDSVPIRLWTHAPPRDGYRLLGDRKSIEVDPSEIFELDRHIETANANA